MLESFFLGSAIFLTSMLLYIGKVASRVRMWTHPNTDGSQGAHSPSCNIKGNISKRGRIMFLPTDKGYDSVKIDTKAGEKWFCKQCNAMQCAILNLVH